MQSELILGGQGAHMIQQNLLFWFGFVDVGIKGDEFMSAMEACRVAFFWLVLLTESEGLRYKVN